MATAKTTTHPTPATLEAFDAAGDALDKIEFVRLALDGLDTIGNDSASNGLSLVLGESLRTLRGIIEQMQTATGMEA